MRSATALLLAASLMAGVARAATLEVGPQRELTMPSAALARAADGDVIAVDPGEYFDCLHVSANRLTVQGTGPGVVLTDRACDGKALVVAAADDLTLRNLTLQRVRVPDGNGAGIRAEGRNLTLEHVQVVNNQSGIIAPGNADSAIRISDSTFQDNGVCDGARCVPGLAFGAVGLVRIERSAISGARGAHQIMSSARLTELIQDRIGDGPNGSASFQVLVSGGSLVMEDCVVEKGRGAANTRSAVLLDGEVTGKLVFRRNRFINNTGASMPFIRNWTNLAAMSEGNIVDPNDGDVTTGGWVANRAKTAYLDMRRMAGKALDLARRAAHKVLE
jgi:hypothetical protein